MPTGLALTVRISVAIYLLKQHKLSSKQPSAALRNAYLPKTLREPCPGVTPLCRYKVAFMSCSHLPLWALGVEFFY